MGLYIETPVTTGKARWLIDNKGATPVKVALGDSPPMPGEGTVLVCVVENGPFDAAAVAVEDSDRDRFATTQNGRDMRPRTWVTLPLATVREMVGELNAERYGL